MLYCREHLYRYVEDEDGRKTLTYAPVEVSAKGKGCKFCSDNLDKYRERKLRKRRRFTHRYEEDE